MEFVRLCGWGGRSASNTTLLEIGGLNELTRRDSIAAYQ